MAHWWASHLAFARIRMNGDVPWAVWRIPALGTENEIPHCECGVLGLTFGEKEEAFVGHAAPLKAASTVMPHSLSSHSGT